MILHQIDFEKDPILRDVREEDFVINTKKSMTVDELLISKGINISHQQVKSTNLINESDIKEIDDSHDDKSDYWINYSLAGILIIVLILLIYILTHKLKL